MTDERCKWSRAEYSIWNTCQGDAWQFHEEGDTPISNGMKFCPFCGKEIRDKIIAYKAALSEEVMRKIENIK